MRHPIVLIAHLQSEFDIAKQIESSLEDLELAVYPDQWEIHKEGQSREAIGKAVSSCDLLLMLWSNSAAASSILEFEWTTALALNKAIVICLLDETPPPEPLRSAHSVTMESLEEGISQIRTTLRLLRLGKLKEEAPATTAEVGTIVMNPSTQDTPGNLAVSTPVPAATAQRDLLPGQQIGTRYRIIRLLGRGGMGAVYLAYDNELERDVALKVIREDLAKDPSILQRFKREIQLSSTVTHKNVLRVYDLGESNGLKYLTMKFVEGEDLAALFKREGQLSVERVLHIFRQICEGLGAAHNSGILHRDLKPSNIMIDGEDVIYLTDFGLARSASGSGLTQTGALMGTPDYMSPEQVKGEPLDVRSDLYSLGIILYQMVTGRVPFSGETAFEVMIQRVQKPPRPASDLNPDLPSFVEKIIGRCMAIEKQARYASVEELLADLEQGITGGHTGLDPKFFIRRFRGNIAALTWPKVVFGASLILLLTFFAYLWLNQQSGSPNTKSISPTSSSDTISIAVLPFVDMSVNRDQEYFSDGLTDELMSDLANIPGLRVTARTSSFQFKGKNEDLRVIGQKLNVSNVLEGSVGKEGKRVRIRVQLCSARDGFNIWSETYERQLDNIFEVQENIARSVAGALKVSLLNNNTSASPSQTKNANAYNDYLRARYFYRRRKKDDLEKSVAYYKSAIQRDPGYASAWAGLAEAHHRLSDNGYLPMDEGYRMARQEVERALALDKNSVLAYSEMAWLKRSHDWDLAGANAAYEQALALDPRNISALNGAAVLAFNLGQYDRAVELDSRAISLDPLNVPTYSNLGLHLYYAGRFDEAIVALKKGMELNPDFPVLHMILGRVYLAQSQMPQALNAMEHEVDPVWRQFGISLAYHALGRKAEADAALAEFIGKHAETMTYQIAQVFAYRGEIDRAFEWLERAYKLRDSGMMDMKGDPLLKSLERDSRYAAFLKKMHLPF